MNINKHFSALWVAASLLMVQSVLAAIPTLSLSANKMTPRVGDTIQVSINLSSTDSFAIWGEFLSFDKAKFQCLSQSSGTFSTFIPDSRDLAGINGTGEIHAGGYAYANHAGGTGTIGVFSFKAVAAGSTTIATANKSTNTAFGNVVQPFLGAEVLPSGGSPLAITIQPSGAATEEGEAGATTSLNTVSPNPFNPALNISYSINKSDVQSRVSLKVFNAQGKVVSLLKEGQNSQGHYTVTWNAIKQPSGFYIIQFKCGQYIATRKVLLTK